MKYKGYDIESLFSGFSVFFAGDEIFFDSVEDAKRFIEEQETREKLFDAMRQDMGVMAEYGDNEAALYEEIQNADSDILEEYKSTFLE